jgi:hypothetical protein
MKKRVKAERELKNGENGQAGGGGAPMRGMRHARSPPAGHPPAAEYGDAPTRCDWPPGLAPIRSRGGASAQLRLWWHLRG